MEKLRDISDMTTMIRALLKKQEQGYIYCVTDRYSAKINDMPYVLKSCHKTYASAEKAAKSHGGSVDEIKNRLWDRGDIVELIKKGDN